MATRRDEQRERARKRVQQDAQDSLSRGGNSVKAPQGMEFFSPDNKERYTLALMPYTVKGPYHPDGCESGDLWYKRPFKTHRNVGAENKIVVCPQSMNKRCPICEARTQLLSTADYDKQQADALKAKDRVLYCVGLRDKKGRLDLKMWEVSFYNFQQQLAQELNDPDNEPHRDFMFPDGGKDIKVRFEEDTFMGQKFYAAGRIDFVEREDLDQESLDAVPDLDACLNVMSYRELQKMFLCLDDADLDGADGDVAADSLPPAKAKKPVAVEDDDPPAKAKKKAPPEDDPPEDDPPAKVKKPPRDNDDSDDPPAKAKKPVAVEDDDPPAKAKKAEGSKCPHGHKWGGGRADEHAECEDCTVWDKCSKA